MAKRQRLIYDGADLTQSLKQSTGQGVDALFSASDDGAVPDGAAPGRRSFPPRRGPARQARGKPARRPPSRTHQRASSKTTTAPKRDANFHVSAIAFQRQPLPRPTSPSVDQPLNRPVNQPVDQQLTGKVVNRPVAFYLPEIINEKIDEAVDYIGKRHRVKVDRSAVVSAILGNPALWEPEALNQLVDKTIGQLTSRLTNRLTKM